MLARSRHESALEVAATMSGHGLHAGDIVGYQCPVLCAQQLDDTDGANTVYANGSDLEFRASNAARPWVLSGSATDESDDSDGCSGWYGLSHAPYGQSYEPRPCLSAWGVVVAVDGDSFTVLVSGSRALKASDTWCATDGQHYEVRGEQATLAADLRGLAVTAAFPWATTNEEHDNAVATWATPVRRIGIRHDGRLWLYSDDSDLVTIGTDQAIGQVPRAALPPSTWCWWVHTDGSLRALWKTAAGVAYKASLGVGSEWSPTLPDEQHIAGWWDWDWDYDEDAVIVWWRRPVYDATNGWQTRYTTGVIS